MLEIFSFLLNSYYYAQRFLIMEAPFEKEPIHHFLSELIYF